MSGLLTMEHHGFIYDLYLRNPKLPADGYIYYIHQRFGLLLSRATITRWFHTIGPFKGSMRETSTFPHSKNAPRTIELLEEYLEFIGTLNNHARLVFADEKPLKSVDLCGRVRRDPITGICPNDICKPNPRNRYNIVTAVTLKRHCPPVTSIVVKVTGTSSLFSEYVSQIIQSGVLSRGDIFVVDNCSIHMRGDNFALQEALFNQAGVLLL